MKDWLWWLIGIILILSLPVIPYEKETEVGNIEVGNKCIAIWTYERYQTVQNNVEEEPLVKEQSVEDAPVAQ